VVRGGIRWTPPHAVGHRLGLHVVDGDLATAREQGGRDRRGGEKNPELAHGETFSGEGGEGGGVWRRRKAKRNRFRLRAPRVRPTTRHRPNTPVERQNVPTARYNRRLNNTTHDGHVARL